MTTEEAVEMLRQLADDLLPDAERDGRSGVVDKYRIGQLAQRRLNVLAAADALLRLSETPKLQESKDDHGAGLIHQVARPLVETEPRPNSEHIGELRILLSLLTCVEGVGIQKISVYTKPQRIAAIEAAITALGNQVGSAPVLLSEASGPYEQERSAIIHPQLGETPSITTARKAVHEAIDDYLDGGFSRCVIDVNLDELIAAVVAQQGQTIERLRQEVNRTIEVAREAGCYFRCDACRATGLVHCSEADRCDGMKLLPPAKRAEAAEAQLKQPPQLSYVGRAPFIYGNPPRGYDSQDAALKQLHDRAINAESQLTALKERT